MKKSSLGLILEWCLTILRSWPLVTLLTIVKNGSGDTLVRWLSICKLQSDLLAAYNNKVNEAIVKTPFHSHAIILPVQIKTACFVLCVHIAIQLHTTCSFKKYTNKIKEIINKIKKHILCIY